MILHPNTFDYQKPTDAQIERMADMRAEFSRLADKVSEMIPDGPDQTYVLRHIREAGMWANVAITRHQDGCPRE